MMEETREGRAISVRLQRNRAPLTKTERIGWMLRHIPKFFPSDAVKFMMEMGHSDYLVIADAGFPGNSCGRRVVRIDGVSIPKILAAVLHFYPLDFFVDFPVRLMDKRPEDGAVKVWEKYGRILRAKDPDKAFKGFKFMSRLDFYEEAKNAYFIIQTGDCTRYGNIILQKGICV